MNIENQIGFSDEFSYGTEIIKYDVGTDNILHLAIEDCARALGVVDTKELKNGNRAVKWDRVYGDLVAIEKIDNSVDFKSMSNEDKKIARNNMKNGTVTERELYLWSFAVNSEQGKKFRNWLATTVLPCLREHGIYVTGMENMDEEQIKRVSAERVEKYLCRKWGIGVRKELTDTIQKIINPSKTESYIYAKYTNLIYEVIFGMECKEYKDELGLKEKDNLRDFLSDKDVNLIRKAEDFLDNLLNARIVNYDILFKMMSDWYSSVSS